MREFRRSCKVNHINQIKSSGNIQLNFLQLLIVVWLVQYAADQASLVRSTVTGWGGGEFLTFCALEIWYGAGMLCELRTTYLLCSCPR